MTAVTLPDGSAFELAQYFPYAALAGRLAGRVTRPTPWDPWRRSWGDSARRLEWLVWVEPGAAEVRVAVSSPRGGAHQAMISLDAHAA